MGGLQWLDHQQMDKGNQIGGQIHGFAYSVAALEFHHAYTF